MSDLFADPTQGLPGYDQTNGNRNVVQTADIVFDDQGGAYLDSFDPGDYVYTDYVILNRFEKDRHRYMMPVTSPAGFDGDTVSFVQLGNPTILWVAEWTAARAGLSPLIPAPLEDDPTWVLLDDHYEPQMITVAADGSTPIYRISGTYVYGHRRPSAVSVDDCFYARPPWLVDEFPRTVPSATYTKNLAEYQGAVNDLTGGTIDGGTTGGGFFGRV